MAQLIDQLRNSEDAAIEVLYKEVFPKFWLYVQQHQGNMEDARDVFQEELIVFLEVVQEKEIDNINGYLYRMLINSWNRRQKKHKVVSMNTNPEIAIKIERTESNKRIIEATQNELLESRYTLIDGLLEEAAPDEKKLLVDFYYKSKPLAIIATEMGLSTAYIRVKKTRLMERLRKKLKDSVIKN